MTNTAFDPATQELSGKYEATQGHSPTFSAFAKKLAQRWVDRYHLAGKRVLEIGCGQGEFISLLCQTASTPGVGIDPILSPDRKSDGGHVTFISDYYGPKFRDLPADFIFCRHTLEHIQKPLAFFANHPRRDRRSDRRPSWRLKCRTRFACCGSARSGTFISSIARTSFLKRCRERSNAPDLT